MLQHAAHEGITGEGFADWAAGITLRECKEEMRKRRREAKAKARASVDPMRVKASTPETETQIDDPGEPKTRQDRQLSLALSLRDNSEIFHSVEWPITAKTFELLLGLILDSGQSRHVPASFLLTASRAIEIAKAPVVLDEDIPF